jgi:DNA-directed RNA polymerase specialized sigma24 family protein
VSPAELVRRRRQENRARELYERWTPVLRGYLRREWGVLSESDREDVIQETWLHYAAAEEGGEFDSADYDSPIKWLTERARFEANEIRKRYARRQTTPTDPLGDQLTALEGGDAERDALEDLDDAEMREFAASLVGSDRQVFAGHFVLGMKAGDIRRATGLSTKRYEKVSARLNDRIREHFMALNLPGLDAAKARLAKALESGEVNQQQLLAAEKIATSDPALADAITRFNNVVHALGLALPADIAARELSGGQVGLFGRIAELADRTKESAGSLFSRGGDQAADAAAAATSGGAAAGGAGAAGTGGLLAAAGGKVAAGLCTGAAATACVAAGVVPGVSLKDLGGDDRAKSAEPAREEVARVDVDQEVARLRAIAESAAPEPTPEPPSDAAPPQPEPESPPPAPEPTPAPAPAPAPDQSVANQTPVVEEFDPIGSPVGSTATSSGSGSSSGGGGGTSSGGGGDFGP